jgi:THO complex subunit 3
MATASKRLKALQDHFRDNNKIKEYRHHSSKIHSVRWNCDGRKLASGSLDKSVIIYSLEKDRFAKEKTFHGHQGPVDQLTWHHFNPDLLATASGDKTVRKVI